MNEIMTAAEAMGNQPPQEAVKRILNHMLADRSRKRVKARAYIDGLFRQEKLHGAYTIYLDKCYPNAEDGDCVYVSSVINASSECEAVISVSPGVRVWLNGEELFGECGGRIFTGKANKVNELYQIRCVLADGKNSLIIKKVKQNGSFNVDVCCSFYLYPHRWSEDYLYNIRAQLPIENCESMEGFAVSGLVGSLMTDDLELACNYEFPKFKAYGGEFDFYRLYPEAAEKQESAAYIYSCAKADTKVKITGLSPYIVRVNGNETETDSEDCIRLNKDDIIVIKVIKEKTWSIRLEADEKMLLPEIEAGDEEWLCAGPFYGGDEFSPEDAVQLAKPYLNSEGERIFWRFNSENLWLRLYMDSSFFGQWFYAIMVGLFGIKECARLIDDRNARNYYLDSVNIMADYFIYAGYDFSRFGSAHIISRSVKLDTWDDIGTAGMCLCDAYELTSEPKFIEVITALAEKIDYIPFFDDGTFYRGKTMWADDFYMSVSFLTRLYRTMREKKYADLILAQIRGYRKRLWMPEEKLFSHIYFPEEKLASGVPWGRGNGWVMTALSEILIYCSDNRQIFDEALALYQDFADGVAANMDECGMWRQVLNRRDSYIETSCSAMFALSLARGVNNDWLDLSYADIAMKAWTALLDRAVDKKGNVYGVCLGSGCHMQAEYYFNIPTHKNDDHGTGIILAAGCEIIHMQKKLMGEFT